MPVVAALAAEEAITMPTAIAAASIRIVFMFVGSRFDRVRGPEEIAARTITVPRDKELPFGSPVPASPA